MLAGGVRFLLGGFVAFCSGSGGGGGGVFLFFFAHPGLYVLLLLQEAYQVRRSCRLGLRKTSGVGGKTGGGETKREQRPTESARVRGSERASERERKLAEGGRPTYRRVSVGNEQEGPRRRLQRPSSSSSSTTATAAWQ